MSEEGQKSSGPVLQNVMDPNPPGTDPGPDGLDLLLSQLMQMKRSLHPGSASVSLARQTGGAACPGVGSWRAGGWGLQGAWWPGSLGFVRALHGAGSVAGEVVQHAAVGQHGQLRVERIGALLPAVLSSLLFLSFLLPLFLLLLLLLALFITALVLVQLGGGATGGWRE